MEKLTKAKIEEFANEIIAFLTKYHMANDTRIYFNGKAIDLNGDWVDLPNDEFDYVVKQKVIKDINPRDYFEYAAQNHILSMSFEGPLYDDLNYDFRHVDEFDKLFEKYGLYYELGFAYTLSAYPRVDTLEVEYTHYN